MGPVVQTNYVILHPGVPFQILENRSVNGRALGDTGATVTQDIGGWVAMPPDHWDAIKRERDAKPK